MMDKDKMKLLATVISQFLKEHNCDEQVVMLLVHDLTEVDGGYTGTMSYMPTLDPQAAIAVMDTQADNLRAGRRGEMVMINTYKGKDDVRRDN